MRILLALLLMFTSLAKADWKGDGNFNTFFGGQFMTNSMNILSNNITIALWLRIRDTGTGLEQKNVFFSKGRLDFTATCNYLLRISGSRLEFNYTDQVGGLHTYRSTSTIIWTNVLRFVALTYTYTNASSMVMYLDGEPIAGSWTSGNGNSNTLPTAHEFSLSGPTAQVAGGGILMGEQGPVMAWTTNLTHHQIQRLYRTRTHGLPYVIHPKLCVFNMTWDNQRTGGQNDGKNANPSRIIYSPITRSVMPPLGQNSSTRVFGSRMFSFEPNE
jgi:hypothetical protein